MNAALWLLLAFGAVIGVGSVACIVNDFGGALITYARNKIGGRK